MGVGKYLAGSSKAPLPRLNGRTPVLQSSIESFENSARQQVGAFIIQDGQRSSSGSTAKTQYWLDSLGNNMLVSQALKRFSQEKYSGRA